jgi:cell division protease FtsH
MRWLSDPNPHHPDPHITQVHVSSKPMADDVNLLDVAYATTGYTGAALANIVNLGALLAAKDNRNTIRQSDLMGALELETLGKVAQESNSEQRQKRLAVHEVRIPTQLIIPTLRLLDPISLPHLLSKVGQGCDDW